MRFAVLLTALVCAPCAASDFAFIFNSSPRPNFGERPSGKLVIESPDISAAWHAEKYAEALRARGLEARTADDWERRGDSLDDAFITIYVQTDFSTTTYEAEVARYESYNAPTGRVRCTSYGRTVDCKELSTPAQRFTGTSKRNVPVRGWTFQTSWMDVRDMNAQGRVRASYTSTAILTGDPSDCTNPSAFTYLAKRSVELITFQEPVEQRERLGRRDTGC